MPLDCGYRCTDGWDVGMGPEYGDYIENADPHCPKHGSGCEPNERKNMTPEELEALPQMAVVLSPLGLVHQKDGKRWLTYNGVQRTSHELSNLPGGPVTLLHPVPEPDHSMCARLVPRGDPVAFSDSSPWKIVSANDRLLINLSDAEARAYGYAIPEPEPTVVERAAKVLRDIPIQWDEGVAVAHMVDPDTAIELVKALDRAGLLVREGEQ